MTPVKDGFPSIWSVIGKERDVPSCRGDQDEVLDLFCFRHWRRFRRGAGRDHKSVGASGQEPTRIDSEGLEGVHTNKRVAEMTELSLRDIVRRGVTFGMSG